MNIELTEQEVTLIRDCLFLAAKSTQVNMDGIRQITTVDFKLITAIQKSKEPVSKEPVA